MAVCWYSNSVSMNESEAYGSVLRDTSLLRAREAAFQRDVLWREYVRRIAAQDHTGLTALYDESSSIVYGLALRVLSSQADAEEVAMDVYTQVWRSAPTYTESRGSVLAWLATIARTRAIDRLRSRGLQVRSEQPLSLAGLLPNDTSTETEVVRRLDAQRLTGAFHLIPPDQRSAMTLAYFSGMSHSEIADHLNVPIGTVKTRIRLGMSKLRQLVRGVS